MATLPATDIDLHPWVLMTAATRRIGDWLCAPLSAAAAVLNVAMLLHPEQMSAVWLGLMATCSAQCPTAYRSFVWSHHERSTPWQVQRAQRIFTLSDTLGYACAPFVGGVLYDYGGLRSCAAFAVAMGCVGAVAPLTLGVFHASLLRWRRREAHATEAQPPEGAEKARPHPESTTAPAAARPGPQTLATVFVLGTVFTNIGVYGVEWCLYALYFRLEHGWSGAWCGFAQMVGDLLGAAVLGISTMERTSEALGSCQLPGRVRALLRPPHSVALLCCGQAALMVMLAQRPFIVALAGQILMG